MRYIASSDITGQDLGTFRSKAAALAAAAAYDTPARKAAHTKRQTGADKAAGQAAARTKAQRAAFQAYWGPKAKARKAGQDQHA